MGVFLSEDYVFYGILTDGFVYCAEDQALHVYQFITDDTAVQPDEENPVADAYGRRCANDSRSDDVGPYAFGTFFEEKFCRAVLTKNFREDVAKEPGGV